MKSNYVDRARKFITEIYPLIDDRTDWSNVNSAVNKFNQINHRNVNFFHGAVRFVLLTSDYVIKWDWSKEARLEYGGCDKELERWHKYEKTPYSYMFVPISKIKVCKRVWYVMPRVRGKRPNHIARYYMTSDEQDFCFDNKIFDLHCGNFVLKHGRPLIFDYAGS